MTTITAQANHAQTSVPILPVDADATTAKHQIAMANGAETTITITVTSSRGIAYVYTVAVTNQFTSRNPSQDSNTLIAAGNNYSQGIWSDGKTMWVGDDLDDSLYAYKVSNQSHNTNKDFGTLRAAGNGKSAPFMVGWHNDVGIGSVGR